MKRIIIRTADKNYLAKPLTLGQLEQHEDAINAIGADSQALHEQITTGSGNANLIPVALLRKQANIIQIGLANHDRNIDPTTAAGFSVAEITAAFREILNGSGLVEVDAEGNAVPGA